MKKFELIDFKKYLVGIKYDTFPNDISEDTLFSSIDLDSMDMVEVFYNIEKDYSINIPLNIIDEDDTIGLFINKLNEIQKTAGFN